MHATIPTLATGLDDGQQSQTDIDRLVVHIERIEGLLPLAIMAFFVGMPLVTTLAKGHPVLAVINAVLLGLIGTFIVRIVRAIILVPLRTVRFARAARALDAALVGQMPAVAIRRRWSETAPGAIAVSPDGEILLVDRATGYEFVRLDRERIADVEIVTDTTVHMTEARRPGFMLGVPLGGLVGGLTLSGPATTTARVAERHGVALRYQKTTNGTVVTSLIPFGGDRDGAVSLKLLLDRLRRPDHASARATTVS